ncbi:MAG: hypothetical protein K1X57_08240 [Gemmataceae bacterium]|nr:hypothetical protein [Gemmataceae bacterium]
MIRILAAIVLLSFLAAPARAVSPPPRATMVCIGDLPSFDWDWDSFRKYWRNQFGKTTGAFGIVAVVVGIGIVIVMSAKKKT